jgi:uncharacterized protein with FMN-binding domain
MISAIESFEPSQEKRGTTMALFYLIRCHYLVFFGLVLATIFNGLALSQDGHSGVTKARHHEIELHQISDGIYRGIVKFEDVWTIEVDVIIADCQITGIELANGDISVLHKSEILIERVLRAQSVEIDAVSGATASSLILLTAIRDALQKGLIQGTKKSCK